MIKTYKIRLYPTPQQESVLWKHIHAARFIWNWGLALEEALYKNGGKHQSAYDLIRLLTPLKKIEEYEWLYEVSNASLQIVMQDLAKAYDSFFKKIQKHPKFKSRRKSKPSFPVRSDGLYFNDSGVHIEKIGKVRFRTNFNISLGREQKFSNPRVQFIDNKWILTVGVECENQARPLTDKAMGIDLGLKDLAIVSYGREQIVFHNINKSKRVRALEHKKAKVQRIISRKYHTNGNFTKTKGVEKYEAIAKEIDRKLRNIRNNYAHQTTHALIELLPYRITVEDLNVSGMMKNRHLSKAIQEQCFTEFIRQIKYKSEWAGIEFIQADRWYPSSKTCSNCGTIKADLKLKDRVYVCDCCGLEIDRDFNAALNLEKYAGYAREPAA